LKLASESKNIYAYFWLTACAVVSVALVFLFLDSHQQDGGYHFLFARWGWNHPAFFVMVWARPLFTFLYSFPAQLGYESARLFTVFICLLTAWHTWKTAKLFNLEKTELVIPFLFFQPSFFLLSAETMTEPLFALLFVIAFRLHLNGYVKTGAFAASLMLLARPEGFFLGILWGVWLLIDERAGTNFIKRGLTATFLATGGLVWIFASWMVTGDVLFIKHNWPSDWGATGGLYGTGTVFAYIIRLPEIVGLFFLPFFFVGIYKAVKERKIITPVSSFLFLFVLHTIFRMFGFFSSAGYPRYFVCVSPAIAIVTLYGWNTLLQREVLKQDFFRRAIAPAIFALSILTAFLYVDAAEWNRDARLAREVHAWFKQNERPVTHFYWSQAYMGIVFNKDNSNQPYLFGEKARKIEILQQAPKGTLIFWDTRSAIKMHNISADEIAALGYKKLFSKPETLKGYLMPDWWNWYGGPRPQEMFLFYKE